VWLTTSHRKILLWNLYRGGQGPIWAVAPLDGWMESLWLLQPVEASEEGQGPRRAVEPMMMTMMMMKVCGYVCQCTGRSIENLQRIGNVSKKSILLHNYLFVNCLTYLRKSKYLNKVGFVGISQK
jgi:hypothetical protein